MLSLVWDRYQPPADEQPEQPGEPEQPKRWPVMPAARAGETRKARPAPYRAGSSKRPTSSAIAPGALALGIAGAGVAIAFVAGGSTSSDEAGDDGWYECIESYQDEEPGILTPADLCEIGHERPDGYTEYDDYDFNPYEGDEYGTWAEWEDEGSGSSFDY